MHSSVSTMCSNIDYYDVVICGGGCAGWVAAVAAARLGARTALIERYGFLGGTATAGLVVPISGFYKNGKRVVGGIAYDFVKQLESIGAARFEMPKGHVSVDTEYYKLVAQRTVLAADVDLITNSYIHDVELKGNTITSITIANKNGVSCISGKYFVDATGDGDICEMAGLPMTISETPQPLSMCFELSGVDCSTSLMRDCIHHDGKNGSHSCNGEIQSFLNSEYKKNGPQFGGPWFNTMLRGDSLAVNVTRNSGDVLNSREFTAAECELREDVFRITELLRNKYAEFKNCHVSATAINAGVRESRHLVGLYTLKESDLIYGTKFEDAIALCAHPMDIHKANSSQQELKEFLDAGSIPYRCMITEKFPNIIATGRTISADMGSYASIRVQATAMALGEAAGTAAALSLNEHIPVKHVSVSTLKDTLISHGAIL